MEQDTLIEICERLTKVETQQNTMNELAKSIQELALSVRSVAEQTRFNTKRLSCIEDEKNQRGLSVWTAVVGAIVGGIGVIVTKYLMK